MLLKRKENWSISENDITAEKDFNNRRFLLKSISLSTAIPFVLSFPSLAFSDQNYNYSPNINKKYILNRKITKKEIATTYTNFYEFGSNKNIWRKASKLITDPNGKLK